MEEVGRLGGQWLSVWEALVSKPRSFRSERPERRQCSQGELEGGAWPGWKEGDPESNSSDKILQLIQNLVLGP